MRVWIQAGLLACFAVCLPTAPSLAAELGVAPQIREVPAVRTKVVRVAQSRPCVSGHCLTSRWRGCPDGYSCYPLYGAYGPYGGRAYWGAYTGW